MKTVPCEIYRKDPASFLLLLGRRNHQRQSDQRWTLSRNYTSRVETFYVYLGEIGTSERGQRWCEHPRGKRWFAEAEFNEAIQNFQTPKTKRCPVRGGR